MEYKITLIVLILNFFIPTTFIPTTKLFSLYSFTYHYAFFKKREKKVTKL
jgi:hypothetical protein